MIYEGLVAQYLITVAPLDQHVEAWWFNPLSSLLFLVILIKTLLEQPLFYVGLLLVFVALTLRKRLAISLPTAGQRATFKVEHQANKEGGRWIHFLGSISSFIILVGSAAVIFEVVRVSPNAGTDTYRTIQEFTDLKHDEGDPLSTNQQALVERYSTPDSRIQLANLGEDERFVATQIVNHKRDQRWLYVQSVLQHCADAYAPKPSQNQISQHFFALWRQLEQEVKTRASGKSSPTPD
jgi:hypothetical protein